MTDRRLSDAQITTALRAHLPSSARAGLLGQVIEAVEVSSQERPLPSFLGAFSDADPIVRRRNLLMAAALLLAVALASATAVGAWRLLQRDSHLILPTSWTSVSSMSAPRSGHTATVLADGRVLVAGGRAAVGGDEMATAEVYDPATMSWTSTGSMSTARGDHQALLLPDGRVVAIGGNETGSELAAEVWDPSTGAWSPLGDARFIPDDDAALLRDGRILVVGGHQLPPDGALLLDPATGAWTKTGPLSETRYNVSLVELRDGTLLLVGGDHLADRGVTAVEHYDPETNSWSVVGSLATDTHTHAATLLDDGRILVVGAESSPATPPFAQLFDPASGRSEVLPWTPPAWAYGDGTRLPDGRILFASSEGAGLYEPASRSWLRLPAMPVPRSGATMSLLGPGAVLFVGGLLPTTDVGTSSSAADQFRYGR